MNWQSVLKANPVMVSPGELTRDEVHPDDIVDVKGGMSNFDRCCEETKDAMRADGTPEMGFIDRHGHRGPKNAQVSVPLEEVDCNQLYDILDNSSHPLPLLSGRNPEKQKQAYARNKPTWDARAKKFNRWLKIWDDCVAKGGGM